MFTVRTVVLKWHNVADFENLLEKWRLEKLVPTFRDCLALQNNVKVKIPKVVESGKYATLHCTFELDGEKLYQVKWYRNSEEFYRFTPSAQDYPIKIFKIRGIQVDEHESKPTKIVLKDVAREISGLFACEVTAEQSFFTGMGTESLQVVDLPARNPYISGLRKRYILNDTLLANCTSEFSYPAANITWYINDVPHFGPTVSRHTLSDGQYLTSYSILRLLITPKYLINSPEMNVKCTATLYNVYNKSAEHSVQLWEHRRKHKNRSNKKHWTPNQIETTTTESQLEVPEVPDSEEHSYDEEHDYHSDPTLSWWYPSRSKASVINIHKLSYTLPAILATTIIRYS